MVAPDPKVNGAQRSGKCLNFSDIHIGPRHGCALDLDTVMRTHLGGRQGCKFGALIFNGGYSIALSIMHAELSAEDIALRLHEPSGAFWTVPEEDEQDDTDVVDATFVDDE